MRKLLLILPLLLMTACVTPQSQTAAPTQHLLVSPFNVQLAAAYETLAGLRMAAAQSLASGTLSVQDATNVQTMADEAHSMLDAARAMYLGGNPFGAQHQLQQVADMLNGLAKLMGKKP